MTRTGGRPARCVRRRSSQQPVRLLSWLLQRGLQHRVSEALFYGVCIQVVDPGVGGSSPLSHPLWVASCTVMPRRTLQWPPGPFFRAFGALRHLLCCLLCPLLRLASRAPRRTPKDRELLQRGLQRNCSAVHHVGQLLDGFRHLTGEEVPIGIHREGDAAMPHDGLDHLWVAADQG